MACEKADQLPAAANKLHFHHSSSFFSAIWKRFDLTESRAVQQLSFSHVSLLLLPGNKKHSALSDTVRRRKRRSCCYTRRSRSLQTCSGSSVLRSLPISSLNLPQTRSVGTLTEFFFSRSPNTQVRGCWRQGRGKRGCGGWRGNCCCDVTGMRCCIPDERHERHEQESGGPLPEGTSVPSV